MRRFVILTCCLAVLGISGCVGNRPGLSSSHGRVVKVQCYFGNGPWEGDPQFLQEVSDEPRRGRYFSVDVRLEEFAQTLSPAEFLRAVAERFRLKYGADYVCAVSVARLDPARQQYVSVEHHWNMRLKSVGGDRAFLGRLKQGDIVLYHGDAW